MAFKKKFRQKSIGFKSLGSFQTHRFESYKINLLSFMFFLIKLPISHCKSASQTSSSFIFFHIQDWLDDDLWDLKSVINY